MGSRPTAYKYTAEQILPDLQERTNPTKKIDELRMVVVFSSQWKTKSKSNCAQMSSFWANDPTAGKATKGTLPWVNQYPNHQISHSNSFKIIQISFPNGWNRQLSSARLDSNASWKPKPGSWAHCPVGHATGLTGDWRRLKATQLSSIPKHMVCMSVSVSVCMRFLVSSQGPAWALEPSQLYILGHS